MIQIKLDILLTMWKRGHNRQFSIIRTKSSYFKLTKEIDSLKPEVSDYDLRTWNQVPPIRFSNMVRVLWSFIVIEQKKITGQDTLQIHQGKYQLSDIQKSTDIQMVCDPMRLFFLFKVGVCISQTFYSMIMKMLGCIQKKAMMVVSY